MTAKVLVADDSLFMRTLLKGLLHERKFEVVEAKNGVEAVEMYEKYRPDLVTLDIIMPEQDGLTTLKRIKTIDAAASIIMISSNGDEANVRQALNEGALDFIQKPFSSYDICNKLENALRRNKVAN